MTEIIKPVGIAYRYVVIYPDGSTMSSIHTRIPHWKELQSYVDGSFQVVPHFSTYTYNGKKLKRGVAYCNEEGLIKHMPFNPAATKAWMEACPDGDPNMMKLHGPVLFIARDKEADDAPKG